MRAVRASGRGGVYDEQRVIVRATAGELVLAGVGKEGTTERVPFAYDGPPQALMTSLVGLRKIVGALAPTDFVTVQVAADRLQLAVRSRNPVALRADVTLCSRTPHR